MPDEVAPADITLEQALEMAVQDTADLEAGKTPDLTATTPRDERGKFVKQKAAVSTAPADVEVHPPSDAPTEAVEPAAENPAKEDPAPAPGALVEARKLWREGDIEGALKLALGPNVDIEKLSFNSDQWKSFKRQWRQSKADADQKVATVQARQLEVQRAAQNLLPLAHARAAYEAGNYEQAFQHAFGESIDAFQRRVIAKMQNPDRTDPATIARIARQEAERMRAEDRTAADTARAAENIRMKEQLVVDHKAELCEEYSQSEDPRIVAVSDDARFLQRVYELECENFHPATKTTISREEAAEEAWQDLYGKAVSAVSGNTRQPAATPAVGARVPRVNGAGARSGTPRRASVQHSRATEANPFDGLEGEDIWKAAEQTMRSSAARR